MRSPRNHSVLGSYYSFSGLIAVLFLLAGCSTASIEYKSRPFFLTEEEVATHGRKSWYDRIVELDPGGAEFTVAADYQQRPPKKIAVTSASATPGPRKAPSAWRYSANRSITG